MGALGIMMLRRGTMANPIAGSDYILSANKGDAEVFRILMEKGVSSDGVGITFEDAARVTSLGTWFKGNTKITSFDEFENFTSVTKLNNAADNNGTPSPFSGCTNLVSIKLPNSITIIGTSAFDNCSSLTYISCDFESITEIGSRAFYNCSLLELGDIVLNNVNIIWRGAFYNCYKLRSVVITSDLNALGTDGWSYGTFENCTGLRSIVLPHTIATIYRYTFRGCTALETVACNAITPPTIDSAIFSGCTALENIYVPDESVEAYKSAANWSTYASRIKPLSEFNG